MQRKAVYMDYSKCRLFDGLERSQSEELLRMCGARSRAFAKGEVVLHEGEIVTDFCIVESGMLEGVRYLIDGSRDVAAVFSEGDVFGDVLAVSGTQRAPVTIAANGESVVLFVPFECFFKCCVSDASARALRNLIQCISDKYFDLNFRLSCISCKTLRDKVLFYLQTVSRHSREPFNIPLDREALADFLRIDRSALSRELSKLKREGIIDYYKNTFKIL